MIPVHTTHPRRLQLEHRVVDFSQSDIQRLKSPTAWLNDICINDGAALLQSYLGGSQSDTIAIISSLVISTLGDGALWRVTYRSAFWRKSRWLVPIHHRHRPSTGCLASLTSPVRRSDSLIALLMRAYGNSIYRCGFVIYITNPTNL